MVDDQFRQRIGAGDVGDEARDDYVAAPRVSDTCFGKDVPDILGKTDGVFGFRAVPLEHATNGSWRSPDGGGDCRT